MLFCIYESKKRTEERNKRRKKLFFLLYIHEGEKKFVLFLFTVLVLVYLSVYITIFDPNIKLYVNLVKRGKL